MIIILYGDIVLSSIRSLDSVDRDLAKKNFNFRYIIYAITKRNPLKGILKSEVSMRCESLGKKFQIWTGDKNSDFLLLIDLEIVNHFNLTLWVNNLREWTYKWKLVTMKLCRFTVKVYILKWDGFRQFIGTIKTKRAWSHDSVLYEQ